MAITYTCSDGRKFDKLGEAESHEASLLEFANIDKLTLVLNLAGHCMDMGRIVEINSEATAYLCREHYQLCSDAYLPEDTIVHIYPGSERKNGTTMLLHWNHLLELKEQLKTLYEAVEIWIKKRDLDI